MSLKDDLVSWWSLDEASDGSVAVPRLDSHGTNHLADSQNAASATGKVGNAASFDRSQFERLAIAATSLQTGDIDFTLACWVRPASVSVTQAIVARDTNSVREYLLYWSIDGNRVRFALFNAGGSIIANVASAVGLSAGSWAYLVAWREGGTAYLQINNGSIASASLTGTPAIKSVPFSIGAQSTGGLAFGGQIDEVAFWRRVLTPEERAELYSGGDGIGYAEIRGGIPLPLLEGYI